MWSDNRALTPSQLYSAGRPQLRFLEPNGPSCDGISISPPPRTVPTTCSRKEAPPSSLAIENGLRSFCRQWTAGLMCRYDAGIGLIFSSTLPAWVPLGLRRWPRRASPPLAAAPNLARLRRTLGIECAKHVVPENLDVPIAAQIVAIRAMGHAPILRYEAILIVAIVLKPQ